MSSKPAARRHSSRSRQSATQLSPGPPCRLSSERMREKAPEKSALRFGSISAARAAKDAVSLRNMSIQTCGLCIACDPNVAGS